MFKVGDRVIQINLDYFTTKIGWTGIITHAGKYSSIVAWDNLNKISGNEMTVDNEHLKLLSGNNYIAYNYKNKLVKR